MARSGALTDGRDALAGAQRDLRAELGDVGIIKGALGDTFVELEAVRTYLGRRLAAEGPLTGRGRTRSLLNAYLHVTDRLVTLARTLGIERQAAVLSVQEKLAQAAAARREQLAREQADHTPAPEGGGQ